MPQRAHLNRRDLLTSLITLAISRFRSDYAPANDTASSAEDIGRFVRQDAVLKSEIANVRALLTDEPRVVTGLRASMRSIISLLLTIAFIVLVWIGVDTALEIGTKVDNGEAAALEKGYNLWKDILIAFLAVYGPILGFWFGEHSALKGRQLEQQEVRSAREYEHQMEERMLQMAERSSGPTGKG